MGQLPDQPLGRGLALGQRSRIQVMHDARIDHFVDPPHRLVADRVLWDIASAANRGHDQVPDGSPRRGPGFGQFADLFGGRDQGSNRARAGVQFADERSDNIGNGVLVVDLECCKSLRHALHDASEFLFLHNAQKICSIADSTIDRPDGYVGPIAHFRDGDARGSFLCQQLQSCRAYASERLAAALLARLSNSFHDITLLAGECGTGQLGAILPQCERREAPPGHRSTEVIRDLVLGRERHSRRAKRCLRSGSATARVFV